MPSIWHKMGDKLGKYLVIRRDGTVPKWPHFVLGARDPWAPAALLAYAEAAAKGGADHEYVDSILLLTQDFQRYRERTGDGDPPAVKHRTDDTPVLAAMSAQVNGVTGQCTVIAVTQE